MNPKITAVTDRVIERSLQTRERYEARMIAAGSAGPRRHRLDCSNLAHGMAACRSLDKLAMQSGLRHVNAINSMTLRKCCENWDRFFLADPLNRSTTTRFTWRWS